MSRALDKQSIEAVKTRSSDPFIIRFGQYASFMEVFLVMSETIRRIVSMPKEIYQSQDDTKYTSFDPPTYSVLDNEKDTDKPSKELRKNPVYKAYGKSVLG